MLKNKITLFSVLVAVIGISVAAFFVAFKGEAQTQQNNNKLDAKVLRKADSTSTKPSDKELDDAATPIVDLTSSTNDVADTKRKEKNKNFNNRHLIDAEFDSDGGEVSVDSETFIPDLPVEMSDLVVEGKVTDSNAFLSEDKTGVYSEFTILVSDVIVSKPPVLVRKHDVITTERFGGRVRFPSGQIVRYRISGVGSPIKNGEYLFFLRKQDDDNYLIITAYEMRGNKIFALDGSRVNFKGKGNSVFDKHNGEDLQDFRQKLGKALKGENQ